MFESGRDDCALFSLVFTEALCASWSGSSCPELQCITNSFEDLYYYMHA